MVDGHCFAITLAYFFHMIGHSLLGRLDRDVDLTADETCNDLIGSLQGAHHSCAIIVLD